MTIELASVESTPTLFMISRKPLNNFESGTSHKISITVLVILLMVIDLLKYLDIGYLDAQAQVHFFRSHDC
jgi:hypothetical protein